MGVKTVSKSRAHVHFVRSPRGSLKCEKWPDPVQGTRQYSPGLQKVSFQTRSTPGSLGQGPVALSDTEPSVGGSESQLSTQNRNMSHELGFPRVLGVST